MERWVTKLLALLIVFTFTLTATLLPIRVHATVLRHGVRGKQILSCLMCFGGGVFLSVYMLHMAPDVKDILNRALLEPKGITYPLAEFIMVIGFFIMVFSEYFVHLASTKKHQQSIIHQEKNTYLDAGKVTKMEKWLSQEDVVTDAKAPNIPNGDMCVMEAKGDSDSHGPNENSVLMKDAEAVVVNGDGKQEDKVEISVVEIEEHGHTHVYDLQSTRSWLLLLALSLHHIFEGMSVGLKHTGTSVWSLCIAIVSHEIIIGFSLGLQLVKTFKSTSKVVGYSILCSAMVPVGVAIGMLIMETGSSASSDDSTLLIVNGVLQALSTGVFIYITFFEILQGEMSGGDPNLTKLLCMLAGFLVLALLGLVPEEQIYSTPTNCTCVTT